MTAKRLLAAAAIACSLPASAATEPIDSGSPMFEKSGDILQWALPLAGLGMTLLLPDGDGKAGLTAAAAADPLGNASALNWPGPRLGGSLLHDFAVAFARMEVATYGLKYTINAERPNGRNGQSFPSGHTASAFMGAEFIRKHHGNAWGVPAHLTAAWVGYTRVDSHNHYWTDVAGGALVGIAANYDLDAIATPWGKLHFGPSSWQAPQPRLGFSSADQEAPQPLALPATGLRFQLNF